MNTNAVRYVGGLAVLIGTVAVGACAHVRPADPGDPVEDARLLLADIVSAEGDAVCAARHVDAEWSLEALDGFRSGEPRAGSMPGDYWRTARAREMNLSQVSAQMSQSFEAGNAAEAAVRAGDPGARRMRDWARQSFDVYADAASRDGGRTTRPGRASEADTRWALAQYASIWSGYFAAEATDEERGAVLDWLTSRSLQNGDVLEAYHEAFTGALRGTCG